MSNLGNRHLSRDRREALQTIGATVAAVSGGGEDYAALAAKFPTPPASAGLVKSGGFAQLSQEAFLRDFAGDIEPAKARVLYAVQRRISDTLFSGKTTHAAWRSKPSWYAISTEDRTISPELQRSMADRMKVKTIEVKASHLALISFRTKSLI
jgi:pimeloyl-ACP methyl ester carboxylesterase